jgi:hypothetical protein
MFTFYTNIFESKGIHNHRDTLPLYFMYWKSWLWDINIFCKCFATEQGEPVLKKRSVRIPAGAPAILIEPLLSFPISPKQILRQ